LRRRARRFVIALRDRVEPFWVVGLAVLLLRVGSRWPGLRGERAEWLSYLLLGLGVPAGVLARHAARAGRWARRVGRIKTSALAVYGLWEGLRFTARHLDAATLIVAMVQWAALVAIAAKEDHERGEDRRAGRVAGAIALLPAVLISWSVAARLSLWAPFGAWVCGSAFTALAFALALVLVTANLGPAGGPGDGGRLRVTPVDVAAAVVLALASVRLDSLGRPGPSRELDELGRFAFFHWGPIVGPAELVRQGGWPLWDVPCQYGFLNTLLLAWLPFGSVWQSLYVVNSALVFLAGLILYAALRALRTGRTNPAFALAVTLAATFVTGDTANLSGPSVGPSLGAYRFFFCYALLALLALACRDGRPGRKALIAGCATWLVGSLWSCESAVYCGVIWLPAFALLAARRAAAGPGRWRRVAAWWSLPPLLAAAALSAVTASYVVALGHPPDWRAFVDYSSSNIRSYGLPIDPEGAAWVPVLALCAVAALASACLRRGRGSGPLPLIVGAWGCLWAAGSYFVVRSHDILILSMSPLLDTVIALALGRLASLRRADPSAPLVRAGLLPILTVILTLAFGNARALPRWGEALRKGYVRNVDRLLPMMDPELVALLDRAGVGPEDPIAYLEESLTMKAMPVRPPRGRGAEVAWRNRAWLPVVPMTLMLPLPDERKWSYCARFVARARAGGWLIQPLYIGTDTVPPWLFAGLARTHVPTRMFASAHWKLTRFEPR
jgi:hypothetical protein